MPENTPTKNEEEEYRLTEIPNQDRDEKLEKNLPPPPDGGYGWMIVAASFICNMVVDGISYCFGIYLSKIVDYYGETKGKTAWVGSLLTGMYLMAGPLVSTVANKYGCRTTCIAGSIISTVAFGLATLSPSVNWLMLSYGFFGGIGLGFMYLPAVVMVGYYFEKRRSLATGIAVCGSGVGTFLFAPLSLFLLDLYGWRGAVLISAGIIFNCCIFGALMRPLEYPNKKQARNPVEHFQSTYDEHFGRRRFNSTVSYSSHKTASEGDAESLVTSRLSLHDGKGHRNVIQPLMRKDIFYSGSITNLKEFKYQKSLDRYRKSITSIPRNEPKENTCLNITKSLGQVLDVSLLKDPVLILIAISSFFGMAGFYIPFIYLVDCAEADGIDPRSASFLLSIIGIVNTVGRIACGYFADYPQVNALLVNNICLIIGAVTVSLVPLCQSYAMYCVISIFFAICISGHISLSSIILVELLDLEKLTSSFGLMILFRGAAALLASPLAGVIYDTTGSYDIPFYISGLFFLISGIAGFSAPYCKRFSSLMKDENGG